MNTLLNQKFESGDESGDEDYVPDAKEIEESERELKKSKSDKKYEEKRAQKIDQLWKEMNSDLPASTNDSASVKSPKSANNTNDTTNKKEDEKNQLDIKKLLEPINGTKEKEKTLKFAGKEFVREKGELKEIPKVNDTTDAKANVDPKAKNNYLKNVLSAIDSKNINSITKSKYDWKEYTAKNKLEKNFAENRKDGYIEKKIFLEKAKQNEHAYITSRRKKIDD